MCHQGWDVFAALPQWWQQDGEDIQTVVEVATKFASIHHLRQIPIRCSHQPHVHLVSPSAAQALEFLFLQYAQQFGLQCRRNIAYLVQEKCAFIGGLETADLLRDGTGECTPFVAKKLTLQQTRRNGGAIQPCEGPPAPGSDVVNRWRDEFLAGAGLSL